MALIAIASDKGAPGVTTAALALAAVWPRPVLLAECDQAGGDLVYRFPAAGGGHLDPRRGVLSLAVVARRGMQPQQVWEHVQKLHGGLDVLAGVTNAEQGAGLSLLWGPIGKVLAGLPQADVIADCGRLGADGPLYDLLVEATTVVLVSKVQVADVIRLRDRAAAFAAAAQSRGRRGFGVGVVVVAEHKKFRAALGEVQHVLGQANAPATVLGGIAHDTKGADLLSGEWGGSLDRTMLIKTAREVAAQLVQSLPPIGDPAEIPPGYPAGAYPPRPAPAHAAPQPPSAQQTQGAYAAQQAPGAQQTYSAHAAQQAPGPRHAPGAHAVPQVPAAQPAPAAHAAGPLPPPVGRRHAAPPADIPPAATFPAPPPTAPSYNGQQFNAPQENGPQGNGSQRNGPQISGPLLSGPQPPRPTGPWQIGPDPSRPDSSRPEPSWPEPARPEPGRLEPSWPEPARAESGRLEPSWPEPARPESDRPQPVPTPVTAAPDLAAVTLSAPPVPGPVTTGPTISADAPRTTFSRVAVTQPGPAQPRARHAAPVPDRAADRPDSPNNPGTPGSPGISTSPGVPGNSGFSRPPMPPLTHQASPAEPGNDQADSTEQPGWGAAPWQRPGPTGSPGSPGSSGPARPGGE